MKRLRNIVWQRFLVAFLVAFGLWVYVDITNNPSTKTTIKLQVQKVGLPEGYVLIDEFGQETTADLVMKARRCQGMDQKELAQVVGVIHQQLRRWEHGGEIPIPSPPACHLRNSALLQRADHEYQPGVRQPNTQRDLAVAVARRSLSRDCTVF